MDWGKGAGEEGFARAEAVVKVLSSSGRELGARFGLLPCTHRALCTVTVPARPPRYTALSSGSCETTSSVRTPVHSPAESSSGCRALSASRSARRGVSADKKAQRG